MLALMVAAILSLEESGSGSGTMSDQCPSSCPKPDRDVFEWFQMLAPIIASVLTVLIAIWQGVATFDSYTQRKEEKQSIQDILNYQRTTLKETITELAEGKDGRTTGLSATIRLRRFFDTDSELGRSGKTPPGRPFWRRILCLKQPPPIHKPPFAKDVANFITAATRYDDKEWTKRFRKDHEIAREEKVEALQKADEKLVLAMKAREVAAAAPAAINKAQVAMADAISNAISGSDEGTGLSPLRNAALTALVSCPTAVSCPAAESDVVLKLYKGGGGDETLRKLLIDGLGQTPTGTLYQQSFWMTDLSGGDFSPKRGLQSEPVDMTKAIFLKADLSEATFLKANCNGALFIEAICVDTKFKKTELHCAEFRQSILIRPYFAKAKLQGATFTRDTYLVDADFSGADIRGCDFSDATVTHTVTGVTKWDGAMYDDKTVFPVPNSRPCSPPDGAIKVPNPPTRPCLTSMRDFLHNVSSYLRRPTWTLLLPTEKTSSKLPDTWNKVHDPKTDKVYYYQVDGGKPQWTRPQSSVVASARTASAPG